MNKNEELPEPNISAFIEELAHLVDKLFPDLSPDLRMFLADQIVSTDEFTSEISEEISESFEYGCWEDDPIQAVKLVVEEFTENAQERLIDLLHNSVLPDMLMDLGAEEDYIFELSDSAHNHFQLSATNEDFQALFSAAMLGLVRSSQNPHLSFGAILTYLEPVPDGHLIATLYHPWRAIVDELSRDWNLAYQIPPHRWEEVIAGAFEQAGYDEVILTPKSGDFGRDIIATRKGVGSVRILGSVKAYAPSNPVKHDDVRALAGVLYGDQKASKGILMTTSTFAPKIATDPFISPLMPYRLELMDGKGLRAWLTDLFNSKIYR
ncbi:restriction endonuclease [Planktothrix agardhii]|jgi:restriction system protein|uniref:restriction endonuclease n=1 Tax=Planktothrix agardhii TaxID=1160 RepID=UPI001D0B8304|nr:restriction endonuclease [Planktothrix agardhii]MCB8761312.1 restriction endonuclease [Planktothrix agardhii 1813]